MVPTPLILARGKQRQDIEFEARLVYIANSRLGGAMWNDPGLNICIKYATKKGTCFLHTWLREGG